MSRTRFELEIRLITLSPIHSGGLDEEVDRSVPSGARERTPRRFVRDGRRQPVITGRSLKGAVRAACAQTSSCSSGSLWGDAGRAASLTFHPIMIPESGIVHRPGIAVDRYWGTAADTALFAHEILPAGVPLEMRITGESRDADQHAEVRRLLEGVLALFKAGRIGLGGRKNAGWGRVALNPHRGEGEESAWTYAEYPLDSRSSLASWLSEEAATASMLPLPLTDGDAAGPVRIMIDWDSPTGVLVAEAPDDEGEPQTPGADSKAETANALQSADDDRRHSRPTRGFKDLPHEQSTDERFTGESAYDQLPLVLPGSSIRGALRSRATRIARTILADRSHEGSASAQGEWARVSQWANTGIHDQLAADPVLVQDLFGSTERRGALSVLDSAATSLGSPRTIMHNAGDRWTGGAADGALFSEEIHADARWSSIVLEFDPQRLGTRDVNRQRAAWCLLGLVLAELATGSLPLGSRSTRGLGAVRVRSIRIEGGSEGFLAHSPLGFLPGDTAPSGVGEEDQGRRIALKLLEYLRSISIEANPAAGPEWTGWSSYLVPSPSSERNEP